VRQHPELQGKPVGVVQYNPHGDLRTRRPDEKRIMNDSNGSLIAVRWACLLLSGCVLCTEQRCNAWDRTGVPNCPACRPRPVLACDCLCRCIYARECDPNLALTPACLAAVQLRGPCLRCEAQHAGGPGAGGVPRHPASAGEQVDGWLPGRQTVGRGGEGRKTDQDEHGACGVMRCCLPSKLLHLTAAPCCCQERHATSLPFSTPYCLLAHCRLCLPN